MNLSTIKPTESGVTYARSPIIYRFINCNLTYSYTATIQATIGTKASLSDYVIINRTADLSSGVTINVSTILSDFIKNETFSYTNPNICYYRIVFKEYNAGALTGTITTNISSASLGYTDYGNIVNYSDSYTTTEYIMNSQTVATYYLPKTAHYALCLRKNGLIDSVDFTYTTTGLTTTTANISISATKTTATTEISTIDCGFKDLDQDYNDFNSDYSYTMKLKDGSSILHTYTFYPDDCNDDELVTLQFMNKWGMWDFFYFDKKDIEVVLDYETYKYNKLDTNYSYDIQFGQYHKSFINGKRKIILNSGWLDDVKNEKLQQLFLSEYIFDYDTGLPLILTDKSVRFKTVKYDKQLQYTINFEEAYDTINTII